MKLSLLEPSETITFGTVVHNNAFKIICLEIKTLRWLWNHNCLTCFEILDL